MKPFNLKSVLNCTILAVGCMATTHSFSADAAPKAQAESSAPKTKQQLVQRLMELWHVEAVGVTMLREPIENALRQSRAALQARTTPEKRDEALKDIENIVMNCWKNSCQRFWKSQKVWPRQLLHP